MSGRHGNILMGKGGNRGCSKIFILLLDCSKSKRTNILTSTKLVVMCFLMV